METLAIVLIIFLVIIFIVLIVGATRYYGNPTIASPLPLRERQIDPENELDLYIIETDEIGRTRQNLAYDYKDATIVFEYFRPEFNFSETPPVSSSYLQTNLALESLNIGITGVLVANFVKIHIGGVTVGVLSQSDGQKRLLYSMIKLFTSSLMDGDQWLLVYTPSQNFEKYSNEFKIYPTILDPLTNIPLSMSILSSLNFSGKISVELISKIDKGLRIRMRTDNMIKELYPETTTNPDIVDQEENDPTYTVGSVGGVGQLQSQEIIARLFP